jgi:hypothetical protein
MKNGKGGKKQIRKEKKQEKYKDRRNETNAEAM